jgi:hypothetical protein
MATTATTPNNLATLASWLAVCLRFPLLTNEESFRAAPLGGLQRQFGCLTQILERVC